MNSESAADGDELSQFREEWKAEVRSRTALKPGNAGIPGSNGAKDNQGGELDLSLPESLPPSESSLGAVELYRQAVRAEEQGKLDDALRLYRRAFRKDANVDRAYSREETSLAASQLLPIPAGSNAGYDEQILTGTLEKLSLSSGSSQLDSLLVAFPGELLFAPQNERSTSPLQSLPLEILLHILFCLASIHDVRTIERFATVCRKARAISLDPTIWRFLVQGTYVPPQIPRIGLLEDISTRYGSNYRKLYKEHPRLRIDGVYIAVCHYVRAGLSENAWVSVSHLITYHRYLRFMPSGEVLSLLANEDADPKEMVQSLQPGLRMKGLLQGRWRLDGTTVHVSDLLDPHAPSAKYRFKMILRLKSRPLGRWNKLDLDHYLSVMQETGEEVAFPLKHERPFWFSKVKSY